MKGRAAVMRAIAAPLVVDEIDFFAPEAGRLLVRTLATPFCSTDCTNVAGGLNKVPPTILGHASIGEVVEVGPGPSRFRVGQRVLVPGTAECGECFYCNVGRPDQCSETFDRADGWPRVARGAEGEIITAAGCVGGYAEYMNVSARQTWALDSDLPDDWLSLLGCGITTGLGAIFNVAQVTPGESVVVVGCGHLGQWAVQAAKLAGAREIVAVEPLAERRELAVRLGATHAVDPSNEDAIAFVRGLTGGRGADNVIETSGPPEAQTLALQLSRRAGTVVLTGLKSATTTVTLPQVQLAVQSRQVLSAQNGNVRMGRDVPRYVRMLEDGLLDAAPIVTSHYALEEINDALAASAELRDLSGVIVPSRSAA